MSFLSKKEIEELNRPTVCQVGNNTRITWAAHLRAYGVYSSIYGSSQSAERLAQRGGFGEAELNVLYPEWRNHILK